MSALLVAFEGSPFGSIQKVMSLVQVPTSSANIWCGSPGVIYASQAFCMATESIGSSVISILSVAIAVVSAAIVVSVSISLFSFLQDAKQSASTVAVNNSFFIIVGLNGWILMLNVRINPALKKQYFTNYKLIKSERECVAIFKFEIFHKQ